MCLDKWGSLHVIKHASIVAVRVCVSSSGNVMQKKIAAIKPRVDMVYGVIQNASSCACSICGLGAGCNYTGLASRRITSLGYRPSPAISPFSFNWNNWCYAELLVMPRRLKPR